MRKIQIVLFVLITFLIVFAGCATSGSSASNQQAGTIQEQEGNKIKVLGQAADFNQAKMQCFQIAVKQVVVSLIGEAAEEANHDKLNNAIYGKAMNFVAEYTIMDKYTSNGVVNVVMEVIVDVQKVQSTLDALGITGGSNSGNQSGQNTANEQSESDSQVYDNDELEVQQAMNQLKPEEIKIIKEYIAHLIYMVYFEEKNISVDESYIRYAISRVNSFLAQNNYEYVDVDQIQKLKEDEEIVRLVSEGGSSELQLIADRLGSDIYTVIDLSINKRMDGNKYIAQVNVTLKMFEAATGRGLGETIGISDELASTSSMDVVIRAAIDNGIQKAVIKVVKMVENKMFVTFKDGIRYKIVLHNVGSTKTRLAFEKAVKATEGFRSLKSVSATKEEAVYFLYYMGTLDQFEEEIFNIISDVPGFENFDEIIKRRNSIEFTMGEN